MAASYRPTGCLSYSESKRMTRYAPRTKRKELLQSLGYIPHPALIQGRSPRRIATDDNIQSRLFVHKAASQILKLTDANQIVEAYEKAQIIYPA